MCHLTMPRAWRPERQLHNEVRVLHADRLRGMQNDVSAEVVGDVATAPDRSIQAKEARRTRETRQTRIDQGC